MKVAITGGAGQIGYALLFRIASGAMFGPDVPVELHLIELEAALPALEGVAMELQDCAFPLLKNVVCTSDLNEGMRDVNWALLIGAVPRKAGMERADLLGINGGIFTAQGKAVNDNAADDVRVLAVGNPCNTNALVAMHNAPDVPNDRFYAMTMLDENRAKAQLAEKAGVDMAAVSDIIIWGNHSATQYPDFEHAKLNGQPVKDVISDREWLETTFIETVQQRGAAVIKARGASSAASAANGVVDTVAAIVGNVPNPEAPFSVALASQGEYGAEPGLIVSYPCQRQADGQIKVLVDWTHSEFGQQKLQATLDELVSERDAVKALGLI